MTSEIDKLKHFHVENYSDTNFTDDLNDGVDILVFVFYNNMILTKDGCLNLHKLLIVLK